MAAIITRATTDQESPRCPRCGTPEITAVTSTHLYRGLARLFHKKAYVCKTYWQCLICDLMWPRKEE